MRLAIPNFAAVFLLSSLAAADVVTDWNAVFRRAAQANDTKSNPGWATRTLAMMNGAVYDSLQAVRRTHEPLLVDMGAPASASFEAAAAQASHRILSLAYPNQIAMFDAALGSTLAEIPDSPSRTVGVDLGTIISDRYIQWRTGDGAEHLIQYMPSSLPGRWRPDPLNPTQEAWGPGWGAVEPFALLSTDQFPVPPPPDMSSSAYTEAFQEVQELGALGSSIRTSDQTQAAHFWAYDRVGTGPPPVLYNSTVSQIADQQGNTAEENARLFAITSLAMADAGVASWDSKYQYDLWRPITAIREAATDGNSNTQADPTWVPLGAPGAGIVPDFTPPFPAYVSGHAAFGAAMFRSLEHFYGTDDVSFVLSSEELPGILRQFDSFSAAAEENARSRIYMGIHWNFDDTEGRALGTHIADWIAASRFAAVPEPTALVLAVLCLAGFGIWRRRLAH